MNNMEEIYRFVSELEQYAVECGMKQRILDVISEIKDSMREGISPDNLSELGQLVEYMEKQKEGEAGEETVSKEAVRERIRKYYEQCLNDNQAEEAGSRNVCQEFIEEAERDMQDYTRVEANFDVVMDEGKFCDAFYRIGKKYARHINGRLEQYVATSSDNYHRMMNQIHGMIQASGLEQITRWDLYQNWDMRYETVWKNCTEKISRINVGEEEITEFAQKHVDEIANKVRKQQRRQRMHKLIPLYILISCIVLFSAGKLLWGQLARQEAESSGNIDQIILDNVINILADGIDILKAFAIAVPCIILLLILWYFYMRKVDKRYHTWVCSSVSGYLSAELGNFRKEDLLNARLDEKFQCLNDYMKQEYETMISCVLGSIMQKNEEDYRQDRIRELRSQWEKIRMEG